MDTKRYIISDAAKMVDVEAHVLRYWEDELELPIARNEMGHRYYTEDNIRMFHHIKELKEQGYQLKAIKVLLPEVEQGKTPPAIVQQPDPPVSDRMEQFQNILGKVVAQALRENQQEMGKELSHQVSTQVVKEMDYPSVSRKNGKRLITKIWTHRSVLHRKIEKLFLLDVKKRRNQKNQR